MVNHKSQEHDVRIYGDTTECHICGKQWDTNDPDPPPCKTSHDFINELREKLNNARD